MSGRPQFDKRTCRPREHVHAAGRLYPNAWSEIDEMRSRRGAGIPNWPDWCFIPIAGAQAAVANDAGLPVEVLHLRHPERLPDAARLAALAAWRMTQGIYRFDPAVYDAVRDTPVTGDVPHQVLFRLPEWCVYIETPEMRFQGDQLHGVFAHLEYDVNNRGTELRLLLDIEHGDGDELMPMVMHLGPWSLAESIARMLDVVSVKMMGAGLGALPGGVAQALRPVFEPIVSLLLYLCSQASEIGDGARRPANPEPKRTKRGWRLFQADRPTTWDVGVRLGAALRRAYQAEQAAAPAQPEGDGRASPCPHIRRAHWHTIWTGPRDGERSAELRWFPPIAVMLDDVAEAPAVVRSVR